MKNALYIRDKDGNFVGIPAISGADGKSAYEQAVEGGYGGTEEEFIRALASLGGEYALQLANSDYDDHIASKNNPHGVTAAQVGALPTTGGIMSGSVKWNDGKTTVIGQGDGNFIIRNYKLSEEGNDDFLAFHNTLPLQNVLRIYRNGTAYDVYGKHNKPTASDVGAVSKTGDNTLSGNLHIRKETALITLGTDANNRSNIRFTPNSRATDIINTKDGTDTTLSLINEVGNDWKTLLRLWVSNGTCYNIFGEHNKPKRTYTGNGGSQTVQIGGLGSVAWLMSSDGLQGHVSKSGFFGMNSNGQAVSQVASFITFENGVLTLNNGGLCNASGIEYTVQVL